MTLSQIQILQLTLLLQDIPDDPREWGSDLAVVFYWISRARTTTQTIFGANSPEHKKFRAMTDLDIGDSLNEVRSLNQRQAILRSTVGELLGRAHAFLTEHIMQGASEAHVQSRRVTSQAFRVFVAHDGGTAARAKVEDFLRSLGAQPIIAEKEPVAGPSVDAHVTAIINTCQYAIAIATKERALVQENKLVPRANIIDEIQRVSNHFATRWMLMLEEQVELPSNQQHVIYYRFSSTSMDEALAGLVRELRSKDFLRIGAQE